MSKVGHNRIQLGDDSDPNKNFVIGTPSPNDGTLEVRKGTVEEPGDLVARFTGTNLELGTTGQAIKSAAFLDAVGTVSQTGGVPTGALMEFGANANGQYWRFASGLQICFRFVPDTHNLSTVTGSLYVALLPSYSYPAAFAAGTVPAVFGTGSSSLNWVAIDPSSTTWATPRIITPLSGRTNTALRLIAIGQWY